jgi:hypothetical protein
MSLFKHHWWWKLVLPSRASVPEGETFGPDRDLKSQPSSQHTLSILKSRFSFHSKTRVLDKGNFP